jgi:hypothetical protein
MSIFPSTVATNGAIEGLMEFCFPFGEATYAHLHQYHVPAPPPPTMSGHHHHHHHHTALSTLSSPSFVAQRPHYHQDHPNNNNIDDDNSSHHRDHANTTAMASTYGNEPHRHRSVLRHQTSFVLLLSGHQDQPVRVCVCECVAKTIWVL